MEAAPDRRQGHLLVAAVRVLEHRLARPPTYEEVGKLLGISHEVVGALARSLESRNILGILATPFDTRLEVRDHLAVEELPEHSGGAAMKNEVEAFLKKARGRQQEREKELAQGDFKEKQKKKFEGLEAQLRDFQKRRVRDPFASVPADENAPEDTPEDTPEDAPEDTPGQGPA